MTRFARAKGSKASNERVPESATPWKFMKEELQKNQKEAQTKEAREEMNRKRQANYVNFLKENSKDSEKEWAEFSDDENSDGSDEDAEEEAPEETNSEDNDDSSDEAPEEITSKIRLAPIVVKPVKIKKKKVVIKKPQEDKMKNKIECFITVHGKKLPLSKFEGCLILKDDATMLQKMKVELLRKGTPAASVQETMLQRKKKAQKKLQLLRRSPGKAQDNKTKNKIESFITVFGKELPLAKYDGSLILKDDATTLIKLKAELLLKKTPAASVKEILRQRRKKAQKKVQRLRARYNDEGRVSDEKKEDGDKKRPPMQRKRKSSEGKEVIPKKVMKVGGAQRKNKKVFRK